MKRILLFIFSFILFTNQIDNTYGQVSIGIGEIPVPGALLQIKNIENISDSKANSTKGFMLPRVELTDVNMLYPMFQTGYNKTLKDPIHAGLVVFNTNADLIDGSGTGVYFWSGEEWQAMTGDTGKAELEVSPDKIILSEFKTSEKALLSLRKTGAIYQLTTSGVEASSLVKELTSGKNTDLTFNRSTSVFGDKTYTFKLKDKPSVQAKVLVSNLGLILGKETLRIGEGSVNGVVNSSTAVQAFGADANWEVFDYSTNTLNWTKTPKNIDGRLVFELGTVKAGTGGNALGEIKVRHTTDKRIVKTIKIEQNKEYRVLPPFDYLVIKYGPGSGLRGKLDIDSATEILKSNISNVDGKAVGFFSGSVSKRASDGIEYMFYAGDDRNTGSETSYVNIPRLKQILEKHPTSSKQIEVGMSAVWYANSNSNKNAVVTISVYKGGEMVEIDKTYVNRINGKNQSPALQFSSSEKRITTTGNSTKESSYKLVYTPMFKLEYDTVDNTGVLIPWNARSIEEKIN